MGAVVYDLALRVKTPVGNPGAWIMTLTLTYLLQTTTLTYTYAEAGGVPIPVIGDNIGGDPDGYAYPVFARTFEYNGAQNLTVYIACGGTGVKRDGGKV
jgi:hypothetical protein